MRRTPKKPVPIPDRRPPVAISYLRFSSLEQRKGDSTRRQTADTEKWCERNGVPLDTTLEDRGRSAFRGKHRGDTAALGTFLELAREGKVPRGSYLIIENLDRLSREDERTALRLWLDILDAGVNIVQLHPETIFGHERSDMTDIIRAIIELSRGHSESRMKSVRSLANWERAVHLAREEGRPITRRLPAWVEEKGGGLRLIPKRAEVVKRIFSLATAGYGMTSIVKKLTEEGVPAFGGRVPDGDGHFRQADGEHYGCGEWRTSYVRSILGDRRALGEFQPRDADERPRGEPIPGYYPPVVSEQEFFAARSAVLNRKVKQGRIGNNVANLFSGLLKNARDGCTYYAATRSDNGVVSRVLLNQSSIEGRSRCYTFPYRSFESALLVMLREVDPREVLGGEDRPADVAVLRGELDWVRERKATLAAELLKGDVPEIGDALRQLREREQELAERLGDAEEKAARPLGESWKQARSLCSVLDNSPDPTDTRLRLRSVLRRMIDSIWLLVANRGKDRLCAAQVWFANSEKFRNYRILHRSPKGNQHSHQPGRIWVESMRYFNSPGVIDFRKKEDAEWALEDLLAWDPERDAEEGDRFLLKGTIVESDE